MSDPRRTLAELNDTVIDRRRFLAFTGALAGTALYAQLRGDLAYAAPQLSGYPFRLGVASGDPTPNGVSLWTRLAPEPLVEGGGVPAKDIGVRWQVASDSNFRHVVKSGKVAAMPEFGHSVHVDVNGLRPGREYFYRFLTDADESPVGRTKTAPGSHDRVRDLKFAFASCQKWDDGFYAPTAAWRMRTSSSSSTSATTSTSTGSAPAGCATPTFPPRSGPSASRSTRYRLQHALYKRIPTFRPRTGCFRGSSPGTTTRSRTTTRASIRVADSEPASFLARRAAAYQAYCENMPVP